MTILDGKASAERLKLWIKNVIERITSITSGLRPKLCVILVGENPASEVYVRNKIKACAAVGIESVLLRYDAAVSQQELLDRIQNLNNDADTDGIMVQLPLPKGFDENLIINTINPQKDVDGLTFEQQGRLFGGAEGLPGCTPAGVIRLLKDYDIPLSGKRAVVIGRSILAGKPLAALLLANNATVTVCHSKTENIGEYTRNAQIIAVCVGKPNFLTADMVSDGCIVVDVGINRTDKGLVGDVAFAEVSAKAAYITPVPGGVGAMTVAMLMRNTLSAFIRRRGLK